MRCEDVKAWWCQARRADVPAVVRQHVAECAGCRRLVEAVRVEGGEAVEPALLASIERRVTAGLTAVRPIAAGRMAWVLGALLAACVAVAALRMGIGGPEAMTPAQRVGVFGALLLAMGWLAAVTVAQVVPGSRQRVSPRFLLLAVPAGLAVVLAATFEVGPQRALLLRAWNCFRGGMPVAAVAAGLAWLVLRRGYASRPRLAAALAGLLAGLAGTAALSLHCPNLNGGHVLLGHLTVAMAGAAGGLLVGVAAERVRQG